MYAKFWGSFSPILAPLLAEWLVWKIVLIIHRISLQQAQISAYIQLEDNPPVNLQFNKVKCPGRILLRIVMLKCWSVRARKMFYLFRKYDAYSILRSHRPSTFVGGKNLVFSIFNLVHNMQTIWSFGYRWPAVLLNSFYPVTYITD